MASLTSASWSAESAIANRGGRPAAAAWRRSRRRAQEWKVLTTARRAAPPTSLAARSRISPAALFVNVTATIVRGSAPASTRRASRCVMTRVFPDPAPARTSSGPFWWRTASFCSGLRPSSERGSGIGRRFTSFDRHALRQIPRLVHVAPAANRDVVGEQLQRHDRENRLQLRDRLGDDENPVSQGFDLLVVTGRHDDRDAVAGFDLPQVRKRLLAPGVVRRQNDDRQVLVHER